MPPLAESASAQFARMVREAQTRADTVLLLDCARCGVQREWRFVYETETHEYYRCPVCGEVQSERK